MYASTHVLCKHIYLTYLNWRGEERRARSFTVTDVAIIRHGLPGYVSMAMMPFTSFVNAMREIGGNTEEGIVQMEACAMRLQETRSKSSNAMALYFVR